MTQGDWGGAMGLGSGEGGAEKSRPGAGRLWIFMIPPMELLRRFRGGRKTSENFRGETMGQFRRFLLRAPGSHRPVGLGLLRGG